MVRIFQIRCRYHNDLPPIGKKQGRSVTIVFQDDVGHPFGSCCGHSANTVNTAISRTFSTRNSHLSPTSRLRGTSVVSNSPLARRQSAGTIRRSGSCGDKHSTTWVHGTRAVEASGGRRVLVPQLRDNRPNRSVSVVFGLFRTRKVQKNRRPQRTTTGGWLVR